MELGGSCREPSQRQARLTGSAGVRPPGLGDSTSQWRWPSAGQASLRRWADGRSLPRWTTAPGERSSCSHHVKLLAMFTVGPALHVAFLTVEPSVLSGWFSEVLEVSLQWSS